MSGSSARRYDRYKPSGISWLGEVPEHWSVNRLKWTVDGCFNGIWGDDPDGVNDLLVVRVADFDRAARKVSLNSPTFRSVSKSARKGRVLRAGDLLIEKSGGGESQPVGTVVKFDHSIPAVCSNFVARVPVKKGFDSSYLCYLHSALYKIGINVLSIKQNTGIQNLDSSAYFDEKVGLPPIDEQRGIARYLDTETAKVDLLISKQERLIELLEEKRKSVITEAVTKGLDPSAKLRDSGVSWIGMVPEHWEVLRIKRVVVSIEQGWSPQCESFPVNTPDEWGVLKVGCVNGGVFQPEENKKLPPELEPVPDYTLKKGDLLISRANTRNLVGSAAAITADYKNLMLCDKLYRLRLAAGRCLPGFLAAYLGTPQARSQIELEATGASNSMLNIGQSVVLDLMAPMPGIGEQTEILRFLANKTERLDALNAKAVEAIALFKERRSALIAAAVTGKIDVRGLA